MQLRGSHSSVFDLESPWSVQRTVVRTRPVVRDLGSFTFIAFNTFGLSLYILWDLTERSPSIKTSMIQI